MRDWPGLISACVAEIQFRKPPVSGIVAEWDGPVSSSHAQDWSRVKLPPILYYGILGL